MLFAYPAPVSADLSSSAEGGGVKQGEVLEGYFAGKDDKGVYADEMAELFCEEGQLGEAAHGEDAAEDELPVGVRRGEAGPDGADGFAFADWGASRDCGVGELRRLCGEEGRTCCSLMLMPSSAIRMADAKLAGGGGAGVAAGFACG